MSTSKSITGDIVPVRLMALLISEIYKSIQGETRFAGHPCTFVRLTACDLRCSYCDTEYAFSGGVRRENAEILSEVEKIGTKLVTVTGGEPLLQKEVLPLISSLLDAGHTVLIETSGAHPIDVIDDRAVVVLDVKCPSSGESERNLLENFSQLKPDDEIKFVIASHEDYTWAKTFIKEHNLSIHPHIQFSWAAPPPTREELKEFPEDHTPLSLGELADMILGDGLEVRFMPQVHKIIWPDQIQSL